ncbi:hypothetical protein [Parasitella parasitica]|uniref:Uncharacterized protein n=1 Tax=Parasitella parasitica TaxID=35722 RepID=A0A0B7NM42_9FUNG|nr:hypothetical protein [Parasitella parasitica]
MVTKRGLYTPVFLVLLLVGARVVGAIAQINVSSEMISVRVSAKHDAFMSFVYNAKANLANHDDLKSRAEAILAEGMSNVSFDDPELFLNLVTPVLGAMYFVQFRRYPKRQFCAVGAWDCDLASFR